MGRLRKQKSNEQIFNKFGNGEIIPGIMDINKHSLNPSRSLHMMRIDYPNPIAFWMEIFHIKTAKFILLSYV